MKYPIRIATLLMISSALATACARIQRDLSGPLITNISTSGTVVVISDCQATSVTITAQVRDESKLTQVLLWYRVDPHRAFAFTTMNHQDDIYTATVKGVDLQDQNYGAVEFYISAEDEAGNHSESPHDESVQFLPCIGS